MKRVSWMAAVLAGLASAGSLLVAGCSPPCGTRPLATYDLRPLDDGTVTWSFQGSPTQTLSIMPGQIAGRDCAFDNASGKIFPSGDGGADWVQGYFALYCAFAGAGTFNIFVNSLGDFRTWSVSRFAIVATADSVGADYYPNTPQQAPTPAGACSPAAGFDGIVLTVTVETAAGGAAPYPTLVTDDFVRTFRLDFDTSTVQPRGNDGAACDLPVAVQVSLHLTQSAADYVYDPNAPRDCNAP